MSEINNIKISSNVPVTSKRNETLRDTNSTNQQGSNSIEKSSDKVSLTDTATQLQSLRNSINDAPTVNQDRVSALKAAIEDGSYKVDSQALARNIISFESQIS